MNENPTIASTALRILTEREMRQVEQWAAQTRLAEMLSFFEALPRRFAVPRPVLLGSNGTHEILVEGLTSRHRVRQAISHLDEPFNPHLLLQMTLLAKKRDKEIATMQPIHRELRKGFEKLCLAKALGGCSERIIHAHTVQEAAFRKHAANGHVYALDPFRTGPEGHWPTPIGIHDATTFTGFCEHHDAELFKPIETAKFVLSPQQLFMFHYRAVAQAFYNRVYQFRPIEQAYAENSSKPDIGSLKSIEEAILNVALDAEELRNLKEFWDQKLRAKEWTAVEGHAWIGTKVPDIFTTDHFGPRKDFQGKIIQNTKGKHPLHWISMTVTAADNRALLLLCAERGSPVLSAFASSMRRLPRNLRTMAAVNYILCQFENFIMLPRWWESLEESIQRRLVNAYDSGYFPRVLPPVCQWSLSEVRQPHCPNEQDRRTSRSVS